MKCEKDPELTSRQYWAERRKAVLGCPRCPPHRNENRTNRKSHGTQKPRRKNYRRA